MRPKLLFTPKLRPAILAETTQRASPNWVFADSPTALIICLYCVPCNYLNDCNVRVAERVRHGAETKTITRTSASSCHQGSTSTSIACAASVQQVAATSSTATELSGAQQVTKDSTSSVEDICLSKVGGPSKLREEQLGITISAEEQLQFIEQASNANRLALTEHIAQLQRSQSRRDRKIAAHLLITTGAICAGLGGFFTWLYFMSK